ncbi:ABC transporter substrate-binding protein [Brachybacterium alimentarium]|uniref:ABC transporter substrate-binding protein n=1 Tax=Brachybacterium alimentarium TaxID=47845 RepID=UPI000DF37104|nr:extracellular solute-binding protein [Brachybacterium alimentarium]RCS75557.1 extracellular solute-binding protein [Brachybacterium alimentarium]
MTMHRFSRRSALGLGAAAGSAALLAGCSTSTSGSGGSGGGGINLWIWPEGFADDVVDDITEGFPDAGFRQVVQGGDFKQKLQTTLQSGSGLPHITGIKGEDIAHFASVAEYFVDLNTLGAEDHKAQYADWKWDQATTLEGQQLGIPIDIGPTALFYRFDVFEKNGLPSDPVELAEAIREWEQLFEMGKQLQAADADTYLIRNLSGVFDIAWRQSGQAFIDEEGVFIGADSHVKNAWDLAITAHDAGINAALESNTPDLAAAVAAGRLPADFGASWHLADLIVDAPDTSGMWHVCEHPGDAANLGGSFLAIPAHVEDQEQAFEIILALLDAKNLAREYAHSGNFPANLEAMESDEVQGEVEFLGGQVAGEVFSHAADYVRPLYEDAVDGTINAPFYAELALVEASGKDPSAAWDAAVAEAERLAEQNGITVG